MNDAGRNNGVTGTLFDFPGNGAKFQGTAYGWGLQQSVATKPRDGRSTGRSAKARRILSLGKLIVRAKVQIAGFPAPTSFEGQEGTATLQIATGKNIAVPVRATGIAYEPAKGAESTTWDLVLTCELTGQPAYTGFGGTQPTATLPSLSDQELFEGLSKTLDPSDLQSAATQTFDVVGLTDSDAAEAAKLAALVAAAVAPMTGLKVRLATMASGRDADGATMTLSFARTTTAEDIINESTTKTVDPSGLTSQATAAAINGSPATPTGDSFVVTATTTKTVNDANTLTIKSYGLRTTEQGIEFDGTYTKLDPSDLESEGIETQVYASSGAAPAATVPAGLQLVATSTSTINPQKDKVQYFYAKDTPKQKLEQENSYTLTDPQGLETEAHVALLDATPSTPAGLYVRGTKSQLATNDHTLNTLICGTRSTKDDREMPGTFYVIDPNSLETEGRDTQVYTGTVAPTVTPAHGTKIVATKDEAVDHVHRQQTVTLGISDSKDKLVNPKTLVEIDPDGLNTRETTSAVDTTAGAAVTGGLSLYSTLNSVPETGHTQQVKEYRPLTSKEEIEHQGTTGTEDPTGGTLSLTTTVSTVAATDTPQILAASALATAIGTATPTISRVSVVKHNKTHAVTRVEKNDDDKTIKSAIRSRWELVKGLPTSDPGWISTTRTATVHVARIPTVGANNTVALIQHMQVLRSRGPVVIRRRRVVTDSASVIAALHLSDLRKVNDATVQAFGAHYLMYSGYDIVEDYKRRDGAHIVVIDYQLEFDSLQFQNETNLAVGWVPTATTSTYISVVGDVTATTYFEANMKLTYPAETDLSWLFT